MTFLPADDPQRTLLHNEIHARPSQRIHVPALIIRVAVLNNNITLEQEYEHLRRLPDQSNLEVKDLQRNFLRFRQADYTLRWGRHSEFTSYTLVQRLPESAQLNATDPELLSFLSLPKNWLSEIPGQTIAAIKLVMVHGDLSRPDEMLANAHNWFGGRPVVASLIGRNSHSLAVTDFMLRDSGFVRMLVISSADTTESRAGRIAQRLLDIETYRLMALRSLPVIRELDAKLDNTEHQLAKITAQLENKTISEQILLDRLISLAVKIERSNVKNMYRFSATYAYNKLVNQRINELREQAVPGTQTIGEALLRRFSPAITRVESTAKRLVSISERTAQASEFLRTRVDIITETQNQQLLEKLTRGQDLQLQLQHTVEGLSIAAISYYVISLILYLTKSAKAVGFPVHPELVTGLLIPIVICIVWYITRRIHKKFLKLDKSSSL